MAAIIIARPAVTAREIAEELGFAQQRSVYYWLRKAGYGGLTRFREAVLTGQYPVATYTEGPFKPRATHVAEVPLTVGDSAQTASSEYVVTTQTVGQATFALAIRSDEYYPIFERHDVLLIDPDVAVADGDIVLVRSKEQPDVLCRAYAGRQPLYVHPVTGRPLLAKTSGNGSAFELLGRVIGLQRRY